MKSRLAINFPTFLVQFLTSAFFPASYIGAEPERTKLICQPERHWLSPQRVILRLIIMSSTRQTLLITKSYQTSSVREARKKPCYHVDRNSPTPAQEIRVFLHSPSLTA